MIHYFLNSLQSIEIGNFVSVTFCTFFVKKYSYAARERFYHMRLLADVSIISIIVSALSRSIRDRYNWRNMHISLSFSINSILRVTPLCFSEHMSCFFPRVPIIISRNYKSRHHRAVHIIKYRVLRCLSFFAKPECVVIYYRENLRVVLSPSHSDENL